MIEPERLLRACQSVEGWRATYEYKRILVVVSHPFEVFSYRSQKGDLDNGLFLMLLLSVMPPVQMGTGHPDGCWVSVEGLHKDPFFDEGQSFAETLGDAIILAFCAWRESVGEAKEVTNGS